MKLPIDWLKDFVDLNEISQDHFFTAFTQSIVEITNTAKIHTHLKHILCAQITDISIHPQNNETYICTISTGQFQYEIHTKLRKLRNGLIVPFSPTGSPVFKTIPIQDENQGMLFSQFNLNLGSSEEFTIDLPQDTLNIGKTLTSVLGIKEETVIEIDNNALSHRPDLWGVYGLARECATLFNREFQSFESQKWQDKILSYFTPEQNPFKLEIDSSDCLAYSIFYVNNLQQPTQTPWRMKQRLIACDMKPINTLVDVSNYLMLEMGLPNHFFDRNTIKSQKIRIAKSKDLSYKVSTLDDQERTLTNNDLVIFDDNNPIAIAGIMGLKQSSVSEYSTDIVVEGGIWSPQTIRKTCHYLGLRTEASIRFEKNLDPQLLNLMLLRCADLIYSLYPKVEISGPIQMGIPITSLPQENITLDLEHAKKLLNMNFSYSQAKNILEKLGFNVHSQSESIISVNPPTWRRTRGKLLDIDLVEEIGRMLGYNNIQTSIPYFPISPKKLPFCVQVKRKIQDFLVYRGQALEIFSNPLIGKKALDFADWPIKNEDLILPRSMSPDHDRFRPSLIPSMISALLLNQKNFNRFKFFEIGKIATKIDQEVQHLGYLHVHKHQNSFMQTVDLLEQLIDFLSIKVDFVSENLQSNLLLPKDWSGKHPQEILYLEYSDTIIGYVISLNPFFCQTRKILGHVSLFEINLDLWINQTAPFTSRTYQPLMKYPGSILDFTAIAKYTTPVAKLIECIRVSEEKPNYITDIKITDVFNQDDNYNAITLRVWLNSEESTLSHDEIQNGVTSITSILEKNGFPLKK